MTVSYQEVHSVYLRCINNFRLQNQKVLTYSAPPLQSSTCWKPGIAGGLWSCRSTRKDRQHPTSSTISACKWNKYKQEMEHKGHVWYSSGQGANIGSAQFRKEHLDRKAASKSYLTVSPNAFLPGIDRYKKTDPDQEIEEVEFINSNNSERLKRRMKTIMESKIPLENKEMGLMIASVLNVRYLMLIFIFTLLRSFRKFHKKSLHQFMSRVLSCSYFTERWCKHSGSHCTTYTSLTTSVYSEKKQTNSYIVPMLSTWKQQFSVAISSP